MGADESDVNYTVDVVYPNDRSVLISCNIKNHTPVFEDARVKVPLKAVNSLLFRRPFMQLINVKYTSLHIVNKSDSCYSLHNVNRDEH